MRPTVLALALAVLALAGCTSPEQTESSTSNGSPSATPPASSSTPVVSATPAATPTPEPTPAPEPEPEPTLVGGTVDADILDVGYDPALITIEPGNSVVWTNRGSLSHSVTSDDGGFSGSGAISPGQSFSFAFNAPGDYAYHCRFHAEMSGTVRVR